MRSSCDFAKTQKVRPIDVHFLSRDVLGRLGDVVMSRHELFTETSHNFGLMLATFLSNEFANRPQAEFVRPLQT